MWSIPKSSADRWRAVIVICEWCILVLWVGAILIEILIPPDSGVFDHQAEKAYLADRARAIAPAAYLMLVISIVLGSAATYRRQFSDGKELFWPAVLLTVLGLVGAQGVWPHVPLCR
jgi:hypothetical protein